MKADGQDEDCGGKREDLGVIPRYFTLMLVEAGNRNKEE